MATGMNILPIEPTQGRDPEGVMMLLEPPKPGAEAKDIKAATKRVLLEDGIFLCEIKKAVPGDEAAAEIMEDTGAALSTRSRRGGGALTAKARRE